MASARPFAPLYKADKISRSKTKFYGRTMMITARTLLYATAIGAAFATTMANAADVINEWAEIKAPPAPEVKAVTLDGKTTALLILDVMKESCARRPRCTEMLPGLQRLHNAARAANVMVFYTLVGGSSPTAADVAAGLTPKDGEWVVQRGPDKFLGSPLEQRLKERGITTVIVTGTSAQGVGIGTGSAAAQRGYKVVVPYDGLAGENAYQEQYAAYHLAKGGPAIVTDQVTLTRTDMIKF
jgi:nicotinamidase-related amidase